MGWTERLAQLVGEDGHAGRVVIIATHGPTPRAVGADLYVTRNRREGRIGRPEMMDAVTTHVRGLLAEQARALRAPPAPSWCRSIGSYPTGDVLGEATGGTVKILIETFGSAEIEALEDQRRRVSDAAIAVRSLEGGTPLELVGDASEVATGAAAHAVPRLLASTSLPLVLAEDASGRQFLAERLEVARTPFHVYGTGLVARALVRLLADLPFDVTWHDRAPAHFPEDPPPRVKQDVEFAPSEAAAAAEPGSFHAVMTGDHSADLAICMAVAKGPPFGFLGVIGAPLKWERLKTRLAAEGIAEAVIARIACPIGLPAIRSKDPSVIAVSVAAQALAVRQEML